MENSNITADINLAMIEDLLSQQDMLLIILPPIVLGFVMAIVWIVLILRRRKKEAAELASSFIDEHADEAEVPSLSSQMIPLVEADQRLKPKPDEKEAAKPSETTRPSEAPPPPKAEPKLEAEHKPEAEPKAEPEEPEDVIEIRKTDHKSWMARLRAGLSKTRHTLTDRLSDILSGKSIDDDTLEDIHEILYRADIGVKTADTLVEHIRKEHGGKKDVAFADLKQSLTDKITEILSRSQKPVNSKPAKGPWVVLVVGVNGVGKTTTIGKLGAHFEAQNKKVLFCAADTYRAAAIDQLQVWGDRLGIEVVKHKQGADPAAVAYDGAKAAVARETDILLVDTAGRLHNKEELMDELGKIKRILGRDVANAPHEVWLVVDATTGQNATQQVRAFKEVVDLTGLVVTKLDGTAKGGVVIGITDTFDMPIRYIGVGEKSSDLREFDPKDFSESLF